jgi:hypothetical protein
MSITIAADKRYFQHTLDYFPSIENDASRITWAHAVNSRAQLQEALESKSKYISFQHSMSLFDDLGSLMFIEADILIDPLTNQPIMAHPPHTSSDLTFSEFLQQTRSSSKGLKLDFKDINALQPCLEELEAQKDYVSFSYCYSN